MAYNFKLQNLHSFTLLASEFFPPWVGSSSSNYKLALKEHSLGQQCQTLAQGIISLSGTKSPTPELRGKGSSQSKNPQQKTFPVITLIPYKYDKAIQHLEMIKFSHASSMLPSVFLHFKQNSCSSICFLKHLDHQTGISI